MGSYALATREVSSINIIYMNNSIHTYIHIYIYIYIHIYIYIG
ncbi:MAG: hypothetical protein N7Q72_02860 [Spiroplasma sp. Tabriz.8]|nr:hypothetical protein [Spiroplasma sp. Tabriz.8]